MSKPRVVPDGPTKCKWSLDADKSADPHRHDRPTRGPVLSTVLEAIGDTPLVRLNKIPAADGVEAEVLAKCEFFNAGGSVKDRIGRRMVEEAELSGRIKKGDVLIEPTSGNTGIGLALAAAVLGYRMIITMPEKMSDEKVNVLKALGAEIVRTPNEAAFDSPESHIGVALRLNKEIPNSHILDQYVNTANPLAHYDGTAAEIWEQTGGKIDAVVAGAGTGGTLTGIARRLKELKPDIKVIGLDPEGSILAYPEALNKTDVTGYQVEGTGYDFIPTVCDRDPSLVDLWIKTNDAQAFPMARRLIREEGLLCGGSSGMAVAGALEACRRLGLGKGKRVVVILPDSVRNYMTKFLSDDWMARYGFPVPPPGSAVIGSVTGSAGGAAGAAVGEPQQWWATKLVGDLRLASPCTVAPDVTCARAIEIMSSAGYDQLPVIDDNGGVLGTVTEGNLMSHIATGRAKSADPVTKCLYKNPLTVGLDMTLAQLSKRFDKEPFAVVVAKQTRITASAADSGTVSQVVCGVVSRIDLLRYIAAGNAVTSGDADK
mmetsp:Transcript_54658/g.133956  ORF Transcript_54658/g.133956 Transcript_54658/m.133956 type:complete len:543 (-) Transcript_54658:74-1702(-)